jgi:outer membrane protein assembly factor BamB
MISLRSSLEKIGEPEPNGTFKPIPSGFHSFPPSLRAAVNAMNPPLMEDWTFVNLDNYNNREWTEECQGIVTDGSFWYVVSNNKIKRAVYKFSLDFILIKVAVSQMNYHIGHPALGNGKIYIPMEPPDEGDNSRVWVLDTDLTSFGTYDMGYNSERDPPGKMPWCAINPWNLYLYSSVSSGVDLVSAYDPNDFTFKGILKIGDEKVNEVQGGCFSNNGHLYLTSDDSVDIRGYSALNGKFLGSFPLDYGHGDEIEGLGLGHINHPPGISSFVHVVILDNEGTEDDVFINHFTLPDPSVL